MYLTVLFGSFAVGSPIWGAVSARLGISNSLLLAGALVCCGALMALLFPLTREIGKDFRPANLPPPEEMNAARRDWAPYFISGDGRAEADFARLMRDQLRRQRLRNGATRWTLVRKEAAQSAPDPSTKNR